MSIYIPIIVAALSIIVAVFQWLRARNEASSFRRQLISVLHHAEGISSEIRILSFVPSPTNTSFSSVTDIQKALNAIASNADSLFLGLIETKIGGKSIKDDLDNKYSELLDLELEKKIMITRDVVKINKGNFKKAPAKKYKKLAWKLYYQ